MMHQIIGISWKVIEPERKYMPRLKLREVGSSDVNEINLIGYNFEFKLSQQRYCIGYFKEDKLHACKIADNSGLGQILDKFDYTQCPVCEKIQGFKSAFLLKQEPNENMKKYLSQPHYIYLAYFEPGIIKVGTASESRKHKRPVEQDALIYCYIAKGNGFNIQNLERAISKQANITETIKSSHKLKFISNKPDKEKAIELLKSTYSRVFNKFKGNEEFAHWFFEEEDIDWVDLSALTEIYYPEAEVKIVKEYTNLSGNFLGLRGRYLILNNYGKIIGFDERGITGRTIEGNEDYKYEVKEDMQLGLIM